MLLLSTKTIVDDVPSGLLEVVCTPVRGVVEVLSEEIRHSWEWAIMIYILNTAQVCISYLMRRVITNK